MASTMDLTAQRPLAGVLNRFAAVLVDGLLPFALCIPAVIVVMLVQGGGPGDLSTIIGTFFVLLTLVAQLCYTALMLAMWSRGLTPGKYWLGVQVIHRPTGLPVSFWRMALREFIGKWVSAIVCYLGFIWPLFDANRQGFHDKVAGTLVVKSR